MTESRTKRRNKHGLNGINVFAYEFLFFLVSPQEVSLFLNFGSDKNKQTNNRTKHGGQMATWRTLS